MFLKRAREYDDIIILFRVKKRDLSTNIYGIYSKTTRQKPSSENHARSIKKSNVV